MIREVTVDGVRSPLLHHGPEDAGEAVVFVHGNPGPKDDWRDLMDRLSPRIRAVAPDMPGFGEADRPRHFDYTADGYARHLGSVIDQLGVRRVHLVVHDFGGPWGLRWVLDHRDALASLTMFNIGVLLGYRWHSFARIWQTPILGELFQLGATRARLKKLLNQSNPKPFPDSFIDRLARYSDWGQKRAVLKLYRASRRVDAQAERFAAGLRGLDVPTLVIWGAQDAFLPARYAEAQREIFPRAEVHTLEGCGHWPFVDEPERVANLVIPFLERHARGPDASATSG
jgi:pimeloyl-ACP methyl ester carboxylesterase